MMHHMSYKANYFELGDTNLISRLTGGGLQILESVGRNNNNNNPGIGRYMLDSKHSVTMKEARIL